MLDNYAPELTMLLSAILFWLLLAWLAQHGRERLLAFERRKFERQYRNTLALIRLFNIKCSRSAVLVCGNQVFHIEWYLSSIDRTTEDIDLLNPAHRYALQRWENYGCPLP